MVTVYKLPQQIAEAPFGSVRTISSLLVERFKSEAPMFLGAWLHVVASALSGKERGVLRDDFGNPVSAARLAALSGFDQDLFSELLKFCEANGLLEVCA